MDLLCKWCRETKPEDQFVKRVRDLPFSQSNVRCCRECNGVRNRSRYTDPGIRAKQLRANAAWRKANPDKMREYEKKSDLANPHHQQARNKVGYLLRTGAWQKQPCVVCGTMDNLEAHHDSYAEPHWDVVRWLCKQHHESWHQRLDPMKREVLDDPLQKAARLREEAAELQEQITRLRDEFRAKVAEFSRLELEAWTEVQLRANLMFPEFLKAS